MTVLHHVTEEELLACEEAHRGVPPWQRSVLDSESVLRLCAEVRRLAALVGPQATSGDPDPVFVPAPPPPVTRGHLERLVASLRERAARVGKRGYYDTDEDVLRDSAVEEALSHVADALEEALDVP